jgi:hypothetical protein
MRYVVYFAPHPAMGRQRVGSFRWYWLARLVARVRTATCTLWPIAVVEPEDPLPKAILLKP